VVTVPVAGDTARAIAILGIRLWAAAVARANQRRLEFALDHRLNELTHPLTQPGFDWINQSSRRWTADLASDCRAGDVVLLLVMAQSPPVCANAGIVWVSAPGDYAILNSNHTPDGTLPSVPALFR
jgi:hypothetical protein